jgi:GST-like protein
MIDLYYWTTPNGDKIVIALEELGLPYRIVPVNISAGEQFKPDFLRISPNNRMPAIVDNEPDDAEGALSIFESGAILEYLADKSGRLLPRSKRQRFEALQWLYWQMAGLGPMAGQNHHFAHYAPEHIPYAIERYINECNRLYGVLDRRLAGRDFISGDYSIADIAGFPWIRAHDWQGQDLADFRNIARWFEAISVRPAVVRAYEVAESINTVPVVSEEARRHLFGQTAKSHAAERH